MPQRCLPYPLEVCCEVRRVGYGSVPEQFLKAIDQRQLRLQSPLSTHADRPKLYPFGREPSVGIVLPQEDAVL